MNKNTFALSIKTLFLIITLSAIAVILGMYKVTNTSTATVNVYAISQSQQQQQIFNTTIFDLQSHLLNAIFNKVENSVVQITSKVPPPLSSSSQDPSNPDQQNATALGSGFVYDTQGHIITNNHVVSNAKIVDVTFIDGNRYTATVIGKDPFSDLAVLKIIGNLTKPISPLSIANSTNLEVGEKVIAIGNPYGLDNTMTTGIVSQTDRLLPESTSFSIPDAIQTDASINPGNSGRSIIKHQWTSYRNKHCRFI